MPVFDLHCDLLSYLARAPKRTPHDPTPRCSLPQLRAGNVHHQVLAIYTETHPSSVSLGMQQLKIYKKLEKETDDISLLLAFENASGFCLETEPLQEGLDRLRNILKEVHPIYISLTWNGENRFGGGCGSDKGLTNDGKELLSFLSGKKIAIDLSHSSDRLAVEIINEIDRRTLDLRLIASHSNFRKVCEHVRNLPDPIAREVIKRKGIIGLVFCCLFLKHPDEIYDMIEHARSMGGENSLAFGADFFSLDDVPLLKPPTDPGFHRTLSDSSCYPALLKRLEELGQPKELLAALSEKNALTFFSK